MSTCIYTVSLFLEPSGYPSIININQSSSSVTVEWQPLECFQENGPITGYNYRIYRNFVDYTEGLVGVNKTGLRVMNTYICMQAFSVAAINKAGIGDHCPPVQIATFNLGNNNITCLNKGVLCTCNT